MKIHHFPGWNNAVEKYLSCKMAAVMNEGDDDIVQKIDQFINVEDAQAVVNVTRTVRFLKLERKMRVKIVWIYRSRKSGAT